MTAIEVRPLTATSWDDFARLFGARGAPHYCWCTVYRLRGGARLDDASRESAMHELVDASVPVGVLAYADGEAVGWCSVAPRESYARLVASRTMPRVSDEDTPTWTVLCFFVPRAHRGRGITRALLDGAIAYARERGADVVEAYPFDTAGISSTHRGHSSVFAAAGFIADGPRWSRRL